MTLYQNKPYEGPSFSFQNRLARALWQFVWLVLFRPTSTPMHMWRCWLLRCFGAKIHKSCHVYSSARIWAPWNLTMEPKACIGPHVICYSMSEITLREAVVVSQGCHLCTGSHDYNSPNFPLFAEPIVIERLAWICADSFVGPGIHIGEGAVIGARSVVVKSLSPWSVFAGNPAKFIKHRQQHRYNSNGS